MYDITSQTMMFCPINATTFSNIEILDEKISNIWNEIKYLDQQVLLHGNEKDIQQLAEYHNSVVLLTDMLMLQIN